MTRPATLDRHRIVTEAGDLVDGNGLEGLTLKRLAMACEVTQPALYRHVDGIADVWRLLGLETRERLATALAESTIGLSGSDAVRAVASAWRDFGRSHPGRYRSTERCPVTGDPELEAAVREVVRILGLALRSYAMGPDDEAHAAGLLRSALHGFVSFELGDGHPDNTAPDETFDRLVDMLCASFEAIGQG